MSEGGLLLYSAQVNAKPPLSPGKSNAPRKRSSVAKKAPARAKKQASKGPHEVILHAKRNLELSIRFSTPGAQPAPLEVQPSSLVQPPLSRDQSASHDEPRSSLAQSRESVRAAALKTVVELFIELGFEGTSLEQVATHAELSLDSLQSVFPTKKDLYLAASKLVYEARFRQAQQAEQQASSTLDRIAAVVETKEILLGKMLQDHPHLASFYPPLFEEALAEKAFWDESFHTLLEMIIDGFRAQQGRSPRLPELTSRRLARALFAMGHGALQESDSLEDAQAHFRLWATALLQGAHS